MIHALVGPNEFAMKLRLKELLEQAGLDGREVDNVDCSELSIGEVMEKLTSQSLFVSTRGFVLKFCSQNKQLAEDLSEKLDDVPGDVTMVFYEPEIDKRSKFYKALKKLPKFEEMKQLGEPELVDWVSKAAGDSGVKISRTQARKIVSMVGLNQQLVASELEKLLSFDGEVTDENIQKVVNVNPNESIFQLLDALTENKTQQALDLYKNLRAQQMEPHYILSMLVWNAHNLLLIKSAKASSEQEVIQATKLSPFVVKKNKKIAQSLSMQDYRSMYKEIVRVDNMLKTSSVNSDLVMEQLITKLGQLF